MRIAAPDGATSAPAPAGVRPFERYAPPGVVAPPDAATAERERPPDPGGADPELVSDFEQADRAIVFPYGAPARQGIWFSYDDGTATCQQVPRPGDLYAPGRPPFPSPGGGLALQASWSGCTAWGGGIGARLVGSGGTGRLVPYDLSAYRGLRFWLLRGDGLDVTLRVTLPMTDDAKIADGGDCDEGQLGVGRCSDAHGAEVHASYPDGVWSKVEVMFDQPDFAQQGWGAQFPWNPAHVTSIQIQSVNLGRPYVFWIDDVELLR
jgi:hypothetical protein